MVKIECPVCTENKYPVSCQKCHYSCCGTCIQKYLLGLTTVDPKCMNCKELWSMEFVHKNFSKEFYDKTFREHRAKIMFEREQSLLPETQEIARQILEEKKNLAEIKRLHEKKTARKNEVKHLNQVRRDLLGQIKEFNGSLHGQDDLKALKAESKELWETLKRKRLRIRKIEHRIIAQRRVGHLDVKVETVKKSIFTTRCTELDCKGYVIEGSSGVPTCGICETVFCNKCLVRVEDEDKHVCDKNTRKTISALKKETRSCPKCFVPIYKISGCDQMYCTECHTPFSWTTGQVETGRIHNPHYYEYQRRVKGTVEREVGDVGGGCQPTDLRVFYIYLGRRHEDLTFVLDIHMLVGHVRDLCQRIFRPMGPNDNQDLRIKYLHNEMDKRQFIQNLKIRDKKDEKHEVFRMVLTMFSDVTDSLLKKLELSFCKENGGRSRHMPDFDRGNGVGFDLARSDLEEKKDSVNFLSNDWDEFRSSVIDLKDYTNEVLGEAEKRFKNKMPYIGPKFNMTGYFRR